jgi:hypothetical protein
MKRKNFAVLFLAWLCIADLVATTLELHYGLVIEANPIMDFYVQIHLLCFVAVKMFMTMLPCYVFYTARHRLVNYGLGLCVLGYLIVDIFHVWGLTQHFLGT